MSDREDFTSAVDVVAQTLQQLNTTQKWLKYYRGSQIVNVTTDGTKSIFSINKSGEVFELSIFITAITTPTEIGILKIYSDSLLIYQQNNLVEFFNSDYYNINKLLYPYHVKIDNTEIYLCLSSSIMFTTKLDVEIEVSGGRFNSNSFIRYGSNT